jgi:hypothetical protein
MEHVVTIVTATPTPTAVVREATTWEAFPTRWGALLDEVWAFVRSSELNAGRNVMVYLDDVPNVEVSVEVSGRSIAGRRRPRASAPPTPPCDAGARPTASGRPACAGRSTRTGATTLGRPSRPRSTGC